MLSALELEDELFETYLVLYKEKVVVWLVSEEPELI